MRRGPLTVPLVLLVMILGACATRGTGEPGPPASPAPTTAPTTAPPTSPTATPTTAPTTAPPETSPAAPAGPVTGVRGGGIAGLEDTIVVRPDGSWRRTARTGAATTGRLPAGELAKLRALAADPRLAAEAGRPVDLGDCADAFEYSVAVGTTTVRYSECPPGPDRAVTAAAIVRLVLTSTGK